MASDVFAKYICTYCQEEIRSLRVKCMECTTFELCLQCFSAGAEIGPHKKDHSYQFIDSVICDVFRDRSGWSAREELHLLSAIEHYSYGNWKDISQHVGTRTPEEAKEEYLGRFLGGDIGRHTWVPGLRNRCKLTDLTTGLEVDPAAAHSLTADTPTTKPPVGDIRSTDAHQLDYMPLRDEFEVEYDNDAESLISHLSANPDDDDLDIALKMTRVEMYTQRLRERARRHKVVHENQLISQFFNNKDKPKKKMSREEKELGEKLRSLCKDQEQQILVGVLKQRRLARRLVELLRFRRNGLLRFEEVPHFEQERQMRHSKPVGGATNISNIQVVPKKNQMPGFTPMDLDQGSFDGEKESSKMSSNGSVTEGSENDLGLELAANAHLLSANEAQLCSALDMTPTQYISMKALMIANPELQAEGETSGHILDHLVSSGWVSSVAMST